jgi:hypothetical protein
MRIGAHVQPEPDPDLTEARGRLATALAAAVAAEAGPDWTPPAKRVTAKRKALAAEWLRVGAALSGHVGAIAARSDLVVEVRMGGTRAGAQAAFYPGQALVEMDAKTFGKLDPATIDPDDDLDRERYPAAWGALTHEAAHAKHTKWKVPKEARGSAAAEVAKMLEELRAEAQLLKARPNDARWLQACVADLVMDEFPTTLPDSPWAAAWSAGLITGRADAGILPRHLAWPVERAARRVLAADMFPKLQAIWQAVPLVGDEDGERMLKLGTAWCKALGVEAEEPAPDPDAKDGESGEGEGKEGEPCPAGTSSPTPGPGKIAAAVRRAARAIAKEASKPTYVPRSPKGAEVDRKKQAKQIAARVFAPDSETAGSSASAVSGTRAPTPAERSAAARLGRALSQAGTRERRELRTSTAAPPGRLNMRGALARDAQRAAGALPTALPWNHTTRRAQPNPPLKVAIAVDVSASMKDAEAPISSAAWILAHAVRLAGPDNASATAAFGDTVTAITRPGKPPTTVTTFSAESGTEMFCGALDALDGALDLTRPGTARLLVIVSDGYLYGPGQRTGGQERITRLAKAGCAVLWLDLTGKAEVMTGATALVLKDPTDAIDAIGKAATRALATAAR